MQQNDSPRVLVPPPLLIIGTLVAGLALDGRLQGWPAPSGASLIVAAVLFGAGLLIGGTALTMFKRCRTNPEPWKPASALVTRGIYKHTRNPMYLGMLLIYVAFELLFESLSAAALLVPLFLLFDRMIIRREENYLSRTFGKSYEEY